MANKLANTDVVEFYTNDQKSAYEKGQNKNYPNLSLVRLASRYFGGEKGRVLDFGCGGGANLLHLLKIGHKVNGVDTSPYSLKMVERMIGSFENLKKNAELQVLDPNAERIPFEDETFDYVVCASVFSLLSTKERILEVLKEFKRVLKPDGKLFLDINGVNSEFAIYSEALGDDLFIYKGRSGNNPPMQVVCFDSEEKLRELVENVFVVDETGITTHKFYEFAEEEYIACARKV